MELVSPCVLPCQNGNCVNKTDKVEKTGMTTEKYRGNAISITAALKSAGQVSAATCAASRPETVRYGGSA